MSDPRTERLLTFFNERGYQPILLGRSDLVPPDVYFLSQNKFQRFGALGRLFDEDNKLPEPKSSRLPQLETIETHAHDAKLGFSFFRELLQRFGLLGAPKGTAKLNLAGDETVRFEDVAAKTVTPMEIESALNRGFDVDKLGKDRVAQGSVHIVYEYLYSSKLEVTLGDRSKASIDLSASAPNAFQLSAGASARSNNVDATTYRNKTPIAVAFKAAQLIKHGSRWRLKLMSSTGTGIVPGQSVPYVFKPNTVLEIEA